MSYVYLFIAIVSEVVATSFLKESHGFTRLGPSLVTIVGYAVAFYCLSLRCARCPRVSPMRSCRASESC